MAEQNIVINKIKMKKPAKVVGIKRVFEGTLKVEVESVWEHKIYKKQMKQYKKYLVQCPKDATYKLDQTVYITQCSKISKRKNWKIIE